MDTISKWREDLAKELVEKARKEVEQDKGNDDGHRSKDELFDSADKKGRIKCLVIRINGRDTSSRMDSCLWCFSIGLLVTKCFIVDVV